MPKQNIHQQSNRNKMEYKYRMLNPPHSTESIDFKLSETYLENCLLVSPAKARDSLTYTVSMETIQDHDYSPHKNYYHQFLHPCQHPSELEIESPYAGEGKTSDPYDLASHQPIVSIRIQPDNGDASPEKLDQVTVIREATEVILCPKLQTKEERNFKKGVLKINNIELQPIAEQETKRQRKMGKVMTRIHSQIKQARTIGRSRTHSRKTLRGSTIHEDSDKRSRIQSAKKQAQMPSPLFYPHQRILAGKKQKPDTINQSSVSIDNLEQAKNSGSTLTKTNSSSNGNCSPQLIRRKSEYTNSKQNSVFLSDRSMQKRRKFKNYKDFNPTTRERVYSTLTPAQNVQTLITVPKIQEKTIVQRSLKQKQQLASKETDRTKILSRLSQNDINLANSLSISAIKLNGVDKNMQNYCRNLKKAVLKENNCTNNQKMVGNFLLDKENNVVDAEIKADVIMNGLKGKKGWRKIKEPALKDLFCV